MTIIYAIILFCLLIFVHELGHFIVAKLCGVKVNEFAIGMGPAFFQKQKGETVYSLRIFPIGGFCAMEGEDEDSDDERAFNNQPAWQRALVLAAGSFMNLLTAVILMIIISFWIGQPTTVINEVTDNSPAQEAGIMTGDRIIAINGTSVDSWNETTALIGKEKNKEVEVTVERDGNRIVLTPIAEFDEKEQRSKIGIRPATEHAPAAALENGVKNTWNMTVMMGKVLKELFTGDVSVKELSGPVGIVYAVNESAKSGVIYVIYLASLLSLNLAIMNMLPFPALDGGRLVFLLIRKVSGKRVTDEMEGKIHFVGIMLLFALMIYVTWNDIIRFIVPVFS
ncbi:MAG: RIP metalloprotease RseP [Bacillota bacterium]|nr:RIP metalloprotease RseP [Bacillota bacterium]